MSFDMERHTHQLLGIQAAIKSAGIAMDIILQDLQDALAAVDEDTEDREPDWVPPSVARLQGIQTMGQPYPEDDPDAP